MNADSIDSDDPEVLLESARGGDSVALGRLLEQYRHYLWLLARTQTDTLLRVRVDPSDLAQEALLKAQQRFAGFRGRTEAELVAWLRKILVRHLADEGRRHHRTQRDVNREKRLEEEFERSSMIVHQAFARRVSSPSSRAARREQAVIVANALAHLPMDYREVLILRHVEGFKFTQIADRMNRSSGAVRMLWVRALEKLNALLEDRL